MHDPGRPGGTLYANAVDAVTALMTHHGHPPSMTEVAEYLGIPLSDLTAVFRDETHLVEAMAENAQILLHDQCIRTVVEVDGQDPVAQFEALADAYIEWAWRHPREFRIIGGMPANQFEGNGQLLRYERALHELMLKLLRRAQDQGALPADENLPMLIAVAHTYAYGVASKMLLGDLSRWAPGMEARDAAKMALYVFTRRFLGRPAGL